MCMQVVKTVHPRKGLSKLKLSGNDERGGKLAKMQHVHATIVIATITIAANKAKGIEAKIEGKVEREVGKTLSIPVVKMAYKKSWKHIYVNLKL